MMTLKMMILPLFLCVFATASAASAASASNSCNQRYYDQDSFVCVCDSTHCDEIEPLKDLSNGQVNIYTTSLKKDRLTQTTTYFNQKSGSNIKTTIDANIKATVDVNKKYQNILGFGGALTDAVVLVRNQILAINESMAELLHRQYFGSKTGLEYKIGRVPIASCDFSDREYSFLEKEGDFHLDTFKLDDIKISYLQKIAKEIPDLNLFATPWSAPGWMKKSGQMLGPGEMKDAFNGRYYLAYAKYIVRFFEEYKKRGVGFWGLTIQNEPETGAIDGWPIQTMYMSAQMQRDFANLRLGPMMKNNWVTKDIKIIAGDGWRSYSYDTAETVYNIQNSPTAVPGDFINGIGVHWYVNTTPFSILTEVHKMKPEKFILATEACNSFLDTDQIPYYGKWGFAEAYAHDIIQNLKNWVVGWADWNLWLDTQGGPNWTGKFVDAPILVNITDKNVEFYKQPMYYSLAHFSKFIPPNSVIVDLEIEGFGNETDLLEGIAALTPDKNVVLVLQNRDDKLTYKLEIDDLIHGNKAIQVELEPKSIKTLIWKYESVSTTVSSFSSQRGDRYVILLSILLIFVTFCKVL